MEFDRISSLESGRQSMFNVAVLMEPLRETCKENLTDVESSFSLFRKNCVVRCVCDLLERCSKQIILGLVLTFYSNLTEKTKYGHRIVEESKYILPKAMIAWMRCDDPMTPLFVDTIVNTVCCRLLQDVDGKAVIVGAIKQVNVFKDYFRNSLKVRNFL